MVAPDAILRVITLPRSVVRSPNSIDRSDNTDVIPLKRIYAISNLAPAVAYGTNGDLLLPHGAPHLPDGGVSC